MVYKEIGSYIFRWTGINLLLGLLGAGITFTAKLGIEQLTFGSQYIISPLLGALVVGVIVYYFDFRAGGLGTNIYISYAKGEKKVSQPIKLLVAKLIATVVTLGLIGVGGLVGPLLLMGSLVAVIVNQGLDKFNCGLVTNKLEHRVLCVCGAASALGPWLGAPLGGGIFASEVLYRSSLDYNDLFPALLGSSFGYFFYQFLEPGKQIKLAVELAPLQFTEILLLIAAAVFCGLLGQGIILLFNKVINWFHGLNWPGIVKPLLAAGMVVLLYKLINPLSVNQVADLFAGEWGPRLLWGLLVYKIITVVIVIASGGSAAIVDVAFFSGALAGSLLYYALPQLSLAALIIVGLSATLASIANVPLAAIVLVMEISSCNSSLPVVIGSIIGFLVGRPRAVFKYIKS